ncbi:MAG: hypothetical protein ACFFBD_20580, partial [Candidatus Hodarchaeota archaeon]
MTLRKEDLYRATIDDMIKLNFPLQVKISPNGTKIAYSVREADLKENKYNILCYVYDTQQNRSFQLTRSGKVTQFEWIKNESLAVLKDNPYNKKEKNQIWFFKGLIGEGLKLTDHKTGVESFKVFAEGILFLAKDPERVEKKSRKEKFGSFTHFEQEKSAAALFYTNFKKIKEYQEKIKEYTEAEAKKLVKPIIELSKILDKPLKIVNFFVSPQDNIIYLNCRSKDELVFLEETSTYQISVDPIKALEEFIAREQSKRKKEKSDNTNEDNNASDKEEDLSYLGEIIPINLPKGARISAISPEGTKLLIIHKERDNMFYTQSDLWVLNLTKSRNKLKAEDLKNYLEKISIDLDQEPTFVKWVKSGIFVAYVEGTKQRISILTESGEVHSIDLQEIFPFSLQFDITEASFITFIGTNEAMYPEVFVASQTSSSNWKIKQLTSFGEKIANWDLGTIETIRWISKDGTEIEG